MKLALVRQRYTPFGGAERFVSQALAALAADAADEGEHSAQAKVDPSPSITPLRLFLYTRHWQQPSTEGQAAALFEPVVCNPFYVGSLWRDVGFIHAVTQAIRRDQPDLVQAHERMSECDIFRAGDGVHRVWLAERARGASWWSRLSTALNPAHWWRLHSESAMFASPRLQAVICISQMVKDEVAAYFPNIANKLHVIYNAVDGERFSPALRSHRADVCARLGIDDAACIFVLVGSGFARKGVRQAIAALPATAHLLVVGKDKHLSRYQRQAQSLGVGDRVHFVGGQNDARPFYGAADVFVLPTLYDPLSNAVLEALATGLPVLTSNKCGAGEIVRAHQAGFCCDAYDVATLAQHMQRLVADEALRVSCAENARRAALTLSREAMTGELKRLYQQVINEKNKQKNKDKTTFRECA